VDAEGTHGGELLGFPGTGRSLAIRGVDMYRLREGRIAESWTFWDLPGMLRRLSAPGAA
jgi:predicted ester cyclase